MFEQKRQDRNIDAANVASHFGKKSAEVAAFLKERAGQSADPICTILISDIPVDQRDRFDPRSPLWVGVQHFSFETKQFADVFPVSGTVIIDMSTRHNPILANQAFDEMSWMPSSPPDE